MIKIVCPPPIDFGRLRPYITIQPPSPFFRPSDIPVENSSMLVVAHQGKITPAKNSCKINITPLLLSV